MRVVHIFAVFFIFQGANPQTSISRGVSIKEESEMYSKFIKNKKEFLINRMAGMDKNTTKIRFYLNLELITYKYNDKTKQTEERF